MTTGYRNRGISHAASTFRERVDDKFLVLFFPSAHGSVCVDKSADIALNIIPLTGFLVKGYAARCRSQGVQNCPYILLGPTSDTDEQVWIAGPDKILHKVQDLVASGWGSSGIRTLIQSVHDDENWRLFWEFDHGFETFYEIVVAGSFGTTAALVVQLTKNIPARIRVVTELEENGGQQATDMALRDVFIVEIMICD
jgi:hypothetical protein